MGMEDMECSCLILSIILGITSLPCTKCQFPKGIEPGFQLGN